MEKQKNEKLSSWATFIAVILILIGLYASARTAINFLFPRYPQSGVLTFNFNGGTPYYQEEEDCKTQTMTYYEQDGKTLRKPTPQEKDQEKINEESCLRGVIKARESAKVNDVTQSILLLFLGSGLLIVRRFFPF